jgi:hypothetical protein
METQEHRPSPPRLMVDPSLLLAASAGEIFEQAAAMGVEIVVAETFAAALENRIDFDLEQLLAPEDLESIDTRLEYARELLATGRLITFSAAGVDLAGDAADVLIELLSADQPVSHIDADQWAFLHTNSWLGAKLRRPLDAFRDAGAVILEVGRKQGLKMISEVIPSDQIPPNLTRNLIVKAAAKWLVVGGASFGGGTLGGALGHAVFGPPGAVGGKILVGRAAKRAAKATVLAIDP